LPYIEQGPLYDKWTYNGYSPGWSHDHVSNRNAVNNVRIDVMLCPSSPLPVFEDTGACNQTMPHYAGIAGAVNEPALRETTETGFVAPVAAVMPMPASPPGAASSRRTKISASRTSPTAPAM
jgi:hypothetical protein